MPGQACAAGYLCPRNCIDKSPFWGEQTASSNGAEQHIFCVKNIPFHPGRLKRDLDILLFIDNCSSPRPDPVETPRDQLQNQSLPQPKTHLSGVLPQ